MPEIASDSHPVLFIVMRIYKVIPVKAPLSYSPLQISVFQSISVVYLHLILPTATYMRKYFQLKLTKPSQRTELNNKQLSCPVLVTLVAMHITAKNSKLTSYKPRSKRHSDLLKGPGPPGIPGYQTSLKFSREIPGISKISSIFGFSILNYFPRN